MSVLTSSLTGWVISHEDFVRDIYNISFKTDGSNSSLSYSKSLFHIMTPFMFNAQAPEFDDLLDEKEKKVKRRKRKFINSNNVLGKKNLDENEVNIVKDKSNSLIESAQKNGYLCSIKNEEMLSKNNLDARLSSDRFFNEMCEQNMPSSNGGNCNDHAIIVNCHGEEFIFPAVSKFYCCDVRELLSKLDSDIVYDLILMDPPWWNKYIRRKKSKNAAEGYKMMYNTELRDLPVGPLLAQDGLVAVWCTNSTSHIQDLINDIFPAWGIQYVATWYWLKVTRGGHPVCSFSKPPGKQPYERIIFGSKAERQKNYHQPEDKKCIVSIPSAIHSHKPPLADILVDYLPSSPRCLELFARYLLPRWTSCGDQVLSLQNVKLFIQEPVVVEQKELN